MGVKRTIVTGFKVLRLYRLLLFVIITCVFDRHDHGGHLGAVTASPSSASLPSRSHNGSVLRMQVMTWMLLTRVVANV